MLGRGQSNRTCSSGYWVARGVRRRVVCIVGLNVSTTVGLETKQKQQQQQHQQWHQLRPRMQIWKCNAHNPSMLLLLLLLLLVLLLWLLQHRHMYVLAHATHSGIGSCRVGGVGEWREMESSAVTFCQLT